MKLPAHSIISRLMSFFHNIARPSLRSDLGTISPCMNLVFSFTFSIPFLLSFVSIKKTMLGSYRCMISCSALTIWRFLNPQFSLRHSLLSAVLPSSHCRYISVLFLKWGLHFTKSLWTPIIFFPRYFTANFPFLTHHRYLGFQLYGLGFSFLSGNFFPFAFSWG